ncbi:hypothetical protein D3C76_1774100 [compost metagenome]
MRQEFVTILAGQGGVKVNAPEASNWLMTPAHFSSQIASVPASKALFQAAHEVANKRLAELSNQFLIPENLDWAGAAWTFPS